MPTEFSEEKNIFREVRLPEAGQLAGYAALIDVFDLKVPFPQVMSLIGRKGRRQRIGPWQVFPRSYEPDPDVRAHLVFALRFEGIDLAVLDALFQTIDPGVIAAWVRSEPTGQYSRRTWFLYEWLTGDRLDVPDVESGNYVDALDGKQFSIIGRPSRRHRVRDNLPGTPAFCPLVRRTERLEQFQGMGLDKQVREVIGRIAPDLLARAAAFLLLEDSKASYAIEGEHPPQDRIQRWGRVIAEAGMHALDASELERLQRIVIGDSRFIHLGYRTEGGFIGTHDRDTQAPIPNHISARPEDLPSLIEGLTEYARRTAADGFDPVAAAAAIAFGFVFIHPFEDGNGRIHRYLFHHILAESGFAPKGMVFPISSAILSRIEEYRSVLEAYSKPLLPLIEWEATPSNNVRVLNDTAVFYRYFDATPQAEFLYDCVRQTIEKDLPEEVTYLGKFDRTRSRIQAFLEMPDSKLELLIAFLQRNGGQFSKRAREKEFHLLTQEEAEAIEAIFQEEFME